MLTGLIRVRNFDKERALNTSKVWTAFMTDTIRILIFLMWHVTNCWPTPLPSKVIFFMSPLLLFLDLLRNCYKVKVKDAKNVKFHNFSRPHLAGEWPWRKIYCTNFNLWKLEEKLSIKMTLDSHWNYFYILFIWFFLSFFVIINTGTDFIFHFSLFSFVTFFIPLFFLIHDNPIFASSQIIR